MSVGDFQGQRAWVASTRRKFEFIWQNYFQRGGVWYHIVIHLPETEDVPASDWWPYLTSFQPGDLPLHRRR